MLYKKINLELIVPADEADAVVAELDMALDRMEERHTLFGGGTETVLIEHSGTRRKSALSHTLRAGKTAIGAVKMAHERVSAALHLVI
jgi:hemin uptake protein HemP